jgi:hypothetical protein
VAGVPPGKTQLQVEILSVTFIGSTEASVKVTVPSSLLSQVKFAGSVPVTVTCFVTVSGQPASFVISNVTLYVPGAPKLTTPGSCKDEEPEGKVHVQLLIVVPAGDVELSAQSAVVSPLSVQVKSAEGAVACMVNVALPAKGPLDAVIVTVACSLKHSRVSRSAVVALPALSVITVIVADPGVVEDPSKYATSGLLLEKRISSLGIGWLLPSLYKANTSISCCPDRTVGGLIDTVIATGATAG